MKKVYILRGIPGAGKSTYAKTLLPATIVSADHFFTAADGTYRWTESKLPQAHAECLRLFVAALQGGDETVVVDNTNINPLDAAPYYALAEAYGYEPEVVTILCNPRIAGARNVHGVVPIKVDRMNINLDKFKLPTKWKQRVIQQK